MGFLDFLGGAVRILFGGAVFVVGLLAATPLIVYGQTIAGVIAIVVGMIGGLYAQYHRGQQSKRM